MGFLLPRLSMAVSLGVGSGGALVDVSSFARLTDGMLLETGRKNDFVDADPGKFSFVLDNKDGRFTPDNPDSPLLSTVTEGIASCVQVGSRLTWGRVLSIEPEFPGDDSAWAIVRVTCADLLGDMSRVRLRSPTQSAVFGATAVWPFSDPGGPGVFADVTGLASPILVRGALEVAYEVSATSPGGYSQATLGMPAAQTVMIQTEPLSSAFIGSPVRYGPGLAGGVWLTPHNTTGYLRVQFNLGEGGLQRRLAVGVNGGNFFVEENGSLVATSPFVAGQAYHLSVDLDPNDLDSATFRINGEEVANFTCIVLGGEGRTIQITVGSASAGETSVSIADLTITPTRVLAESIIGGTVPERLQFLSGTSSVQWATLPTNLQPTQLTSAETNGTSLLEAVNKVIDVERGHLSTLTTGALTSATATVVVRERDRPTVPVAEFDVTTELQGAPAFVRDISRLVSSVVIDSSAGSTVVVDASLVSRAGQASDSVSLPIALDGDRSLWGQDRLQRGGTTGLRIASVIVDAMTTPTDRGADLLALVAGDCVRFTGLPSTVLGFDTWDGWLLGVSETHTIDRHEFQLFLAPVLPETAIYDTDRFMADGELTLSGNINDSVTSITVASTGALLSTTEEPYSIILDSEEMTVTTVTGATSPQTVTVTRGVNGTTAAAHTSGAVVVSTPDSLYAF